MCSHHLFHKEWDFQREWGDGEVFLRCQRCGLRSHGVQTGPLRLTTRLPGTRRGIGWRRRHDTGRVQTAGYLVWHLSTKWRVAVDRALNGLGLTHAHYLVLGSLAEFSRSGASPASGNSRTSQDSRSCTSRSWFGDWSAPACCGALITPTIRARFSWS